MKYLSKAYKKLSRTFLVLKFSYKKRIAFLFIFGYLLQLFPLLYISRYNVPSVDDYASLAPLMLAKIQSPLDLNWISVLWNYMIQSYKTMQGTFSSFLFVPLLPLTSYYLGAIILFITFSLSMYFMLKIILGHILGLQRENIIILFSIIATLCIQPMPSAVEGFYWWSGAMLYTGFFALAMITLSYFFWLLRQKYEIKKSGHYILFFILLFLVEGGNYPTALAVCIILFFTLLYIAFEKRQFLSLVIIAFMISLAGLFCNVAAPGNGARLVREEVAYNPTLLRTIYISFLLGFQFFRTYFTAVTALTMVLAFPVIYNGLRNTKRQFRCPLFFGLCTFCTFCALFAPTAYTYGWIGPLRYMNIVYFGFVLLIFANEVYFTGWICAKLNASNLIQNGVIKRSYGEEILVESVKTKTGFILCAIICIIWALTRQNFYVDDVTVNQTPYATESAIISLKTGQAQEYYNWYHHRKILLEDPTTDILEFEAYPVYLRPDILYFDDITENVDDWRNDLMANYYGKTSVVLIPAESTVENNK